jgi:hypothetical protein
VDGRPFFGDDPSATLKNLPSEVVDKIQVFDQLSEQSQFTGVDDGNTLKTMNIVTKQNMRNSRFGNVYAGYGTNERYKTGGQVNVFKGTNRLSIIAQSNNINEQNFSPEDLVGAMSSGRRGRSGGGRSGGPGGDMGNFLVNQSNGVSKTHALGLNYSGKIGSKIELTASYFFNNSNNSSIQTTTRNYIANSGVGNVYNETSTSQKNNTNHRFNLKLEYSIDTMNMLIWRPRLTLQDNTSEAVVTGLTTKDTLTKNNSLNITTADLQGLNFSNDLTYSHKFRKKGRNFSINLTNGINTNTGPSSLVSSSRFFGANPTTDTTNQQSTRDKNTQSYTSFVSFTESITPKASLMLGYYISHQNNDSEKLTYNQLAQATNQIYPLDTAYTNTFTSGYLTQRAGLTYIYRFSNATFNAGFDWEKSDLDKQQEFPITVELQKTFYSLLPSFQYNYKPERGTNIRITYRTRTKSPSIDQLQNVVNNTNALQLSIGNPNLLQDYTHQLSARYSTSMKDRKRMFFIMMDASFTNNYVANATYSATSDTVINGILVQDGATLTQPVNLSGYSNIRAFTTLGLPLDSLKLNLNFNFGVNYTRTPGQINDQINYSSSPSLVAGVVISSNISEYIDFTLSSQTSLSFVSNTLQKTLDGQYLNQNTRFSFFWNFYKGFFIQNNISHQYYTGLSDGYNQNFFLWNTAAGIKFLKNNQGEVKLSVADVLDQNKAIQRTVTSTYIEDTESNLLHRYALLTFTYKIKHYRASGTPENERERPPRFGRPDGPPPPMGGEGTGMPF